MSLPKITLPILVSKVKNHPHANRKTENGGIIIPPSAPNGQAAFCTCGDRVAGNQRGAAGEPRGIHLEATNPPPILP